MSQAFILQTDKGRYRVQFRLEGQRVTHYFGTKDRLVALPLLHKMELDWLAGDFDNTLARYKVRGSKSGEQAIKDLGSRRKTATPKLKIKAKKKQLPLLAVWDAWVESLHLSDETLNGHYHATRQIILRAGPVNWDDTAWFKSLRDGYSSSTFNSRRRLLANCLRWAVQTGLVPGPNPYFFIALSRKGRVTPIQPFSANEIQAILQAFITNRFVHPCSHYFHDHYVPFIFFLFSYGSRLGEARALTWQQIDWEQGTIRIDRALGRDLAMGPYRTRPVVKQTKTGFVNWLPLTDPIRQTLLSLNPDSQKPTDYVFTGHHGGPVDIRGFRKTWKSVLDSLGIPYRYPYQCRHTVLSQIATQYGLAGAAIIAGHQSIESVSRYYARFVGNKADILPIVPFGPYVKQSENNQTA